MSSDQFIDEAIQNKTGKNAGKRAIWFNGTKIDPLTKEKVEYTKDRYNKYFACDFSVFKKIAGAITVQSPDNEDIDDDD
jgi:hypothetical protein